jgi:hypothetical protein
MTALNTLLDYTQNLDVEASPMVEVTRQIGPSGEFEWYGLLNHTGQLGNGFFKPLPIYGTKLSFKPQKPVKSVKNLVESKPVEFSVNAEGWVEAILPQLDSYNLLLVEYQ